MRGGQAGGTAAKLTDVGSGPRLGRVRLVGFLAVVVAGVGLDLFGVFGEDNSFSSTWRRPLASGMHAVDDVAGFGFSHGSEVQLLARGGLAGLAPAEVAVALLDAGLAAAECQIDALGQWSDPVRLDSRVCGDAVAVLGCTDDRVMVACPISCRRCHGDKRMYAASASVTPASGNAQPPPRNTAARPPIAAQEPLPPLSAELSLKLFDAGLAAAECPEGIGSDPAAPVRDLRVVMCMDVRLQRNSSESPRPACCSLQDGMICAVPTLSCRDSRV